MFKGGYRSTTEKSTMKIRWKVLLVKITVWLIAEILLTCLGLDDFADYSEFLNEKRFAAKYYTHGTS